MAASNNQLKNSYLGNGSKAEVNRGCSIWRPYNSDSPLCFIKSTSLPNMLRVHRTAFGLVRINVVTAHKSQERDTMMCMVKKRLACAGNGLRSGSRRARRTDSKPSIRRPASRSLRPVGELSARVGVHDSECVLQGQRRRQHRSHRVSLLRRGASLLRCARLRGVVEVLVGDGDVEVAANADKVARALQCE
eukprot:2019545-Pleurochrysis_carterae.AAC.8